MTTTPRTRIGKTTVAALLVGSNLRRFTPQWPGPTREDVAAPHQLGRAVGWGTGHAAAEGQLGRCCRRADIEAVGIVADNSNVVGAVISTSSSAPTSRFVAAMIALFLNGPLDSCGERTPPCPVPAKSRQPTDVKCHWRGLQQTRRAPGEIGLHLGAQFNQPGPALRRRRDTSAARAMSGSTPKSASIVAAATISSALRAAWRYVPDTMRWSDCSDELASS